jgi:hypothetical protein
MLLPVPTWARVEIFISRVADERAGVGVGVGEGDGVGDGVGEAPVVGVGEGLDDTASDCTVAKGVVPFVPPTT